MGQAESNGNLGPGSDECFYTMHSVITVVATRHSG